MDDISKRIDRIESEIDKLPAGYISRKNIRGRMQLYYQWVEDGKKKSKYLNDKKAEEDGIEICCRVCFVRIIKTNLDRRKRGLSD